MTQSCENLVTEGQADKQRDTQVRVISLGAVPLTSSFQHETENPVQNN